MVTKIKTIKATYDFAKQGGAISAIALGAQIPTGAWITRAYIKKVTAITSGGSATIALAIGGVALLAATAFDNAVFTAAVATSTVTPALTTTATGITATVAVAALTAGSFDVIVEYVV
jgi:nitrate reductase gamma subunit